MSSAREEMLASLCLIGEGSDSRALFSYLSGAQEERLNKVANRLLRGGNLKGREAAAAIARLARLESGSALQEIHPGWILEALAHESPRVLGLICRFLPGEKVRYLLNHLPAHEKARLPKLIESYSVDPAILEIVRNLVEAKLGTVRPPEEDRFTFAHIAWMKGNDLKILFSELGLNEIRKAFYRGDSRSLKAFLSRFPVVQATEIRRRIEGSPNVTPEEKKRAQLHLLALTLEDQAPEGLLQEIGYSSFAGALQASDMAWLDNLVRRLAPEEGHRLRRIARERADDSAPAEAAAHKEAVVSVIFALAYMAKIRRYWREDEEFEVTKSERLAS